MEKGSSDLYNPTPLFRKINNELLIKDGVKDISTFYGYYVLNAMAKAGNYKKAMSFISQYWGAFLDCNASIICIQAEILIL